MARLTVDPQAREAASHRSRGGPPPRQAAVDEATRRAQALADRYQRAYPAAAACLTSTLDWLTVHLRFPRGHWQRIRHTNLLERTSGGPPPHQGDRPAPR
jgi:hypothetical protein